MTETKIPTAAELNEHLTKGGTVYVSTYLRCTKYSPKHAGMFFNGAKTGALYVKAGRSKNCLASNGILMVGITLA